MMEDDFLLRCRPAVPAGLEARVLKRISTQRARGAESRATQRVVARARAWCGRHKLAALAAAVALVAGCSAGILRIAGFVFELGEEPPSAPPAGAEPVPQRVVSRDEALAAIPFEVGLPTWVPEGYELSDQAMITLPGSQAALSKAWQLWLYWENEAGAQVLLLAFPSEFYRGDALEFGPEAVEEISLDGTPAAAVRGNWGPSGGGTWEVTLGGNVLWVRGETAYWLQSAWVSLEDLIRMAGSLR